MSRSLRMAVSALRRDWRGGELTVLAVALVVAVGSVSSVGFFTSRIERAMQQQATELLAADLLLTSRAPLPARYAEEARARELATARTMTFRSVVLAGEATELVELKAVQSGYPLRGTLRTAAQAFGEEESESDVPQPGEAWVESRLLLALGIAVGDSIEVGEASFRVARVLTYEPDRGGEVFAIAPRLMMHLNDVPATELIAPGSRVNYNLLIAGDRSAVAKYRGWLGQQLQPGESLQGVQDARPELRTALDRAQQFLGLAALVSVVVSGVAVAIAARRFALRRWDVAAIMRCLGATQGLVLRLYVLELLLLGVLAGLAGVALGYLAQAALASVLGQLFAGDLPSPGGRPVVPALTTGLVVLAGFALPPVLRLRHVPPLRVLRRDMTPWPGLPGGLYLAALAAVGGLMLWYAGDARLTAWIAGGSLVTLVVLAGLAWLMVKALGRLRGRVGVSWRFGLANIARRGGTSVVQTVALGLGIMVLLVLSLVRADLLEDWRQSLPADAPNYFLINVQPHDVEDLRQFLAERGVDAAGLYPMVRARLISINGREVTPEDYPEPRARRLAEREFNLSWADQLSGDNRIVAGEWWGETSGAAAELSVEEGIADSLGFELGDQLHFQVAGQKVEATITSLRSVEWDSFRPNFFVLARPGVLNDFPATWITSFHLEPGRGALLNDLVRAFPGATVLDVAALMTRVRQIIDRVVLGVEYVFGFTLLAGLLVLYAAIQATRDERMYEGALLRTMGAGRRVLGGGLLAEFALVGALAGTLAAVAAGVIGLGLSEFLFGMSYRPDPWLWLIGAGFGTVGVAVAGYWATRGVLSRPPLEVLRQG